MIPLSKVGDITIGWGSHGKKCCPHIIIGIRITGSYDTSTNLAVSSRGPYDISSHNCPHCGIGMCIQGSSQISINNLPAHRVGDAVTEFCGSGITVTGSNDTFGY